MGLYFTLFDDTKFRRDYEMNLKKTILFDFFTRGTKTYLRRWRNPSGCAFNQRMSPLRST